MNVLNRCDACGRSFLQAAARFACGGSRSITTAPSRMTAFSASSGRASNDRSARGSPSTMTRSARAPGSMTPTVAGGSTNSCPALSVPQLQHVGRREAVDLAVVGELAAVVADLVVERVVVDQRAEHPAVVVADQDADAGLLRHRKHRAHVVVDLAASRRTAGVPDLEQAPEVDEARHPEGARLDHPLDALVVDLVAVVEDVDAELDALEDHLLVGHVRPHLRAALVRGRPRPPRSRRAPCCGGAVRGCRARRWP